MEAPLAIFTFYGPPGFEQSLEGGLLNIWCIYGVITAASREGNAA